MRARIRRPQLQVELEAAVRLARRLPPSLCKNQTLGLQQPSGEGLTVTVVTVPLAVGPLQQSVTFYYYNVDSFDRCSPLQRFSMFCEPRRFHD